MIMSYCIQISWCIELAKCYVIPSKLIVQCQVPYKILIAVFLNSVGRGSQEAMFAIDCGVAGFLDKVNWLDLTGEPLNFFAL